MQDIAATAAPCAPLEWHSHTSQLLVSQVILAFQGFKCRQVFRAKHFVSLKPPMAKSRRLSYQCIFGVREISSPWRSLVSDIPSQPRRTGSITVIVGLPSQSHETQRCLASRVSRIFGTEARSEGIGDQTLVPYETSTCVLYLWLLVSTEFPECLKGL